MAKACIIFRHVIYCYLFVILNAVAVFITLLIAAKRQISRGCLGFIMSFFFFFFGREVDFLQLRYFIVIIVIIRVSVTTIATLTNITTSSSCCCCLILFLLWNILLWRTQIDNTCAKTPSHILFLYFFTNQTVRTTLSCSAV